MDGKRYRRSAIVRLRSPFFAGAGRARQGEDGGWRMEWEKAGGALPFAFRSPSYGDGCIIGSKSAAFCGKPLREKGRRFAFARLCPPLPAFARLAMARAKGEPARRGVGVSALRIWPSARICPELPAFQQNIFSPQRDSTREARGPHSKTLKCNH